MVLHSRHSRQSLSRSVGSMKPALEIVAANLIGDTSSFPRVSLHSLPRDNVAKVVHTSSEEMTFARLDFESSTP